MCFVLALSQRLCETDEAANQPNRGGATIFRIAVCNTGGTRNKKMRLYNKGIGIHEEK